MEEYDPVYAKKVYERLIKKGGPKILFKDLIINGEENLQKSSDKCRLYLANHLSHADYLVAWYAFHKHDAKIPMIAAGKNLDIDFMKKRGLDFSRLGAFWVDREKVESCQREEISSLTEKIKEIYGQSNDILVFPEGGRSYSGNLFDNFKTGIIKKSLMSQKELEIVPIAFDYTKRIEEGFFPLMKKVKSCGNLGNSLYKIIDAGTFIKAYIYKGNRTAFINIGKPKSLEEISSNTEDLPKTISSITEFSKQEIRNLFREIQGIKTPGIIYNKNYQF